VQTESPEAARAPVAFMSERQEEEVAPEPARAPLARMREAQVAEDELESILGRLARAVTCCYHYSNHRVGHRRTSDALVGQETETEAHHLATSPRPPCHGKVVGIRVIVALPWHELLWLC
jgi:hypothetical protein